MNIVGWTYKKGINYYLIQCRLCDKLALIPVKTNMKNKCSCGVTDIFPNPPIITNFMHTIFTAYNVNTTKHYVGIVISGTDFRSEFAKIIERRFYPDMSRDKDAGHQFLLKKRRSVQTLKQAYNLEMMLITGYDSMNPEKGYNTEITMDRVLNAKTKGTS